MPLPKPEIRRKLPLRGRHDRQALKHSHCGPRCRDRGLLLDHSLMSPLFTPAPPRPRPRNRNTGELLRASAGCAWLPPMRLAWILAAVIGANPQPVTAASVYLEAFI